MGPDDADKIHQCEVHSEYERSLHVPADYKRLGKWLIINCKSAGDLT